jgi:hypothetical protein
MDNQKQILQTGLYSESGEEVEKLVERVTKFNLQNLATPVKVDIIPYEEGDENHPAPHYKLRFLFPNRDIQARFWTT